MLSIGTLAHRSVHPGRGHLWRMTLTTCPCAARRIFGRSGQTAPAAMFNLGAGEAHASLHNPDYDFPDELIGIAARVMMRTRRDLLG